MQRHAGRRHTPPATAHKPQPGNAAWISKSEFSLFGRSWPLRSGAVGGPRSWYAACAAAERAGHPPQRAWRRDARIQAERMSIFETDLGQLALLS